MFMLWLSRSGGSPVIINSDLHLSSNIVFVIVLIILVILVLSPIDAWTYVVFLHLNRTVDGAVSVLLLTVSRG